MSEGISKFADAQKSLLRLIAGKRASLRAKVTQPLNELQEPPRHVPGR